MYKRILAEIVTRFGRKTSHNSASQMMKPHVPLIKFPKRRPVTQFQRPLGNPNSVESLVTENMAPNTSSTSSTKVNAKGPFIDSSELPTRFRRKPISFEEIEYIEKGGPV